MAIQIVLPNQELRLAAIIKDARVSGHVRCLLMTAQLCLMAWPLIWAHDFLKSSVDSPKVKQLLVGLSNVRQRFREPRQAAVHYQSSHHSFLASSSQLVTCKCVACLITQKLAPRTPSNTPPPPIKGEQQNKKDPQIRS